MKYKSILLFGLFLLVLHQTAYSQKPGNGLEIANHENIYITVEDLTSDASEIGLTKNRILSRIEVRLRQLGIKPIDELILPAYLYANIHVVGSAYSIRLEFQREVYYFEHIEPDDQIHNKTAVVWNTVNTGTHGGLSEHIISALDGLLDIFISEYLKAND